MGDVSSGAKVCCNLKSNDAGLTNPSALALGK